MSGGGVIRFFVLTNASPEPEHSSTNHKMIQGTTSFPPPTSPSHSLRLSLDRSQVPINMLRRATLLFSFFSFLSTFVLASSNVIDHEVLQCTTKAFTSAWSETFNSFVGLTPKYTPGTFIAVDCTQLPNLRCSDIPENAK
jgi:hypothetical protein